VLAQWPGSVSLLLSVSLFKFITWDRSQLVGLGIPLRFIAKPSYSPPATNPNVSSKPFWTNLLTYFVEKKL
jgi:hypothetical protein